MRTNASDDKHWRLVFADGDGDGVGFGCVLEYRGDRWIVTGASKKKNEVYLSRDNEHATETPESLGQLMWFPNDSRLKLGGKNG